MVLACLGVPAFASSGHSIDGASLNLFWVLPFFGILASIALGPLLIPSLWHHHYGKLSFGWALLVIIPLFVKYNAIVAFHQVAETYFHHFFPFIILISSLYVVTHGLRLTLLFQGTPRNNTVLLLLATFIASWIGTTGAALLFIKPFLQMNTQRVYKIHLVIFFIFLVCNIGGCLSALGDPPLFLGFLNGVDFFWPTIALFYPFCLVTMPLLFTFFCLDLFFYKKYDEGREERKASLTEKKISIEGKEQIGFLLGILLIVILTGSWKSPFSVKLFSVSLEVNGIVRDLALVSLTLLSYFCTIKRIKQEQDFSWGPLLEVAKLFAAIFITAFPVIAILHAGEEGALSFLVKLVWEEGQPVNAMYFWLTGLLSAFLDNAPTYLIFFHLAGGEAMQLMTELKTTLVAISLGSVFMGALTYIGNAPNFMIKAIAEEHEIQMPTFLAYMGWSFLFLLPLFLILSLIYF
jgi:Na+/H+ antiporter NhaD/arsenite permease-like protein